MSDIGRVRRNSLFVLLTNITRLISNFILFAIIARSYGPVEFGRFSAVHVLSTIFLIVADFGFDILLVSNLPKQRTNVAEATQRYLFTKGLFALVASLLMAVYAALGGVRAEALTLALVFAFYVFFSALINFFCAFFKAMEVMEEETKVSLLMNLLLLIGVVVLSWRAESVMSLAVMFSASRLIGLLYAVYRVNKLMPLRSLHFELVRRDEFRYVWVYGFHALLGALYFVQDTLLLSYWSDNYNVGIYQAVFKVIYASLLPGDVLIAALLPSLSRLNVESDERWKALGRLLHKTLLYVALSIAVVVLVYAEEVIGFVYGQEYLQDGPTVLRLLVVVVVLRYASDGSGAILTSANEQGKRLKVVATAAFANLLLNWYLIPQMGARGAGVASVVTGVFVAIGYVAYAWEQVRLWFKEIDVYLILGFAVLIGLAAWWANLPIWIAAPVMLCCLLPVILFKGYTESERHALFSMNRIPAEAVR